jgi:hypothetical protein
MGVDIEPKGVEEAGAADDLITAKRWSGTNIEGVTLQRLYREASRKVFLHHSGTL